MIDSLCVLGGGTSGLIVALMAREAYPKLKITMLESSKLGIIGVGEGSTEHWKKFINQIGINVPELVRETGATFKIGIKFTNWHGDGTHYFHSLSEQFGSHSFKNGLPFTWFQIVGENWDPLDTAWKLSMDSRHIEPLHDILSQYHFDTFKLNDYLHRLCKIRGIDIVDTEVEDVILDEQGFVKELIDVNHTRHAYDFYVDCSGFRRVIGSKLGAKWIDCTDKLPMNSAIAFPTGYTEDIPSYTEATALTSGWCWRIPTQERYGNGYVFCDNFINETQAYDEVSEYYKQSNIADKIEIGRKVKFGAGYVDKFWIKNCAMIGLSGIFVEPLEASSIGTTIQQTFMLLPSLMFFNRDEEITSNKYNFMMKKVSTNIVDFIQLHYFTQRSDSEFWRWCKNELVLTDFNKEYLDYFKKNMPNVYYFNDPMILFSHLNFTQVMHGLRLFDNDKILKTYESHLSQYTLETNNILKDIDDQVANNEIFSHRQALEILKERYEKTHYKL
jgi:tryptophan halogenase